MWHAGTTVASFGDRRAAVLIDVLQQSPTNESSGVAGDDAVGYGRVGDGRLAFHE